jgi:hypothetical protein
MKTVMSTDHGQHLQKLHHLYWKDCLLQKRLWFSKTTGKDWHCVRIRVEKVRKAKLNLGKDGQYKRQDPSGATLLHEISTASYTCGQMRNSYCIVEIQSQTLQPLPCLYPITQHNLLHRMLGHTYQMQNTVLQLHTCHVILMQCTNKPTYFCRLCDRHQGALQEYW